MSANRRRPQANPILAGAIDPEMQKAAMVHGERLRILSPSVAARSSPYPLPGTCGLERKTAHWRDGTSRWSWGGPELTTSMAVRTQSDTSWRRKAPN
jgi:hypothetical protein